MLSLEQTVANKNIAGLNKVYYTLMKNYSLSKPKPYHPNVDPNHPGFKTRPPHDVFPEDIECVLEPTNGKGAIFIGNLEAAESLTTLKKLNIASVLTACKNVHIRHPKDHVPYALYIPGEDHENYDLSVHFDTAINFIHQSRQETNILVHCMAGVSRSVTLVLAYLMKHMGMGYHQAYSLVQRNRNKINPNPGFVRQLQKLEQSLAINRSRRRHSENDEPVRQSYELSAKSKGYEDYAYNSSQTFKRTGMENPSASLASRYDRTEKSQQRTYQYQTSSKAEEYSSKYSALSFTLQQSKTIYNPEYEANKYSAGYYQSLKGSLYKQSQPTIAPPNSSLGNTRFQVLTSVTNQQETIDRSRVRDNSYQTLSNDLDARIAKIKEKYYESGEKRELGGDRWDLGRTYGQKKVNNFVGENVDVSAGLARSRASRESLRQSIYSPYAATRPLAYQYA